MGRTQPTYRNQIASLEDEWDAFGRTLRRRYHEPYERLWVHARDFANAGGAVNAGDPMKTVLLSICLAQEHELQRLRATVEQLDS